MGTISRLPRRRSEEAPVDVLQARLKGSSSGTYEAARPAMYAPMVYRDEQQRLLALVVEEPWAMRVSSPGLYAVITPRQKP